MESGVLAAQQPFPHDHHTYAAQGSAGTHNPVHTNTTTGTSSSVAAAGSQSMPLEQLNGYESQASLTNKPKKKKKKPTGKPEESIIWKGKNASASPYIAHLIEKAPKVAQTKEPFGVRIVAGEHAEQEITLPANPRPAAAARGHDAAAVTGGGNAHRAVGRSSAENLRAAVAGAAGGSGDSRSRSRSRTNNTAPSEQPVKDLHSSILDELSELGLGPPAPMPVKVGKQPAPRMTKASTDRDRSRSKSRTRDRTGGTTTTTGSRGGSSSNQRGKPLSAAGIKNTASLPALQHAPPTTTAVANTNKKQPAKRNPALPPSRRPAQLQPLPTTGKTKSAHSNSRSSSKQRGPSSPYLSPSKKLSNPAELCAKLEELERSLVEEREVRYAAYMSI